MQEIKNLTLMIVEDDERLRDTLETALKPFFAKIYSAKNGDEGLKKFKKFSPNLIITDIAMPIFDGLEMAQEVKKITKDTPIIVLSAYSEKERLLRAIDVGIDKYLIKPVDVDELLRVVKAVWDEKLPTNSLLVINEHFSFERSQKVLIRDGERIWLTKKELAFVVLMLKQVGALVLHEDIKRSVWANESATDAAMRTFIKRVRDKVGEGLIKSVPGLGYRVVV